MQVQATTQMPPQRLQDFHGKSHPGGIPQGMGAAVKQLSVEQIEEVKTMMESLSEEQQAQLKQGLDELKPRSQDMTMKEIGLAFFEVLAEITSGSAKAESTRSVTETSTEFSSSHNQVDTYI